MRLRKLLATVPIDSVDVIGLVSLAVLTVGVAMIYVPAAFIVAGGLGLLYAIAASRGGGES